MIKKFNEQENFNKISRWELDDKIEKLIERNIKEIPWEGTDVNKSGLKESIWDLIYQLRPEFKPENYFDSNF